MEWKEIRLGDILNFRRGHDLPHSKMIAGKIPVAGSNGIIGYHNVATPVKPLLTIGRSGNIGTPYIYETAWAHNTTLYIDDFKGNHPLFLYYLCKILPFANFQAGSAVPTLNRNHIHQLIVKYPPNYTDQSRIASILSSLDSKIETNNKINAKLEEMAQALFKSWFVDFEPFKDKGMVESELGMIPEGWRVEKLGDVCDCVLGGTPSRNHDEYWNGDIAWINSGEVNKFRIIEASEYITEIGLAKSATKLLPKKTTVLAITGATLGQVSLLEIDTCANQSVIGVKESEQIKYGFIYPLISYKIKELITHQTGGAQQHINKQNVESLTFVLPTMNVLDEYYKKINPLLSEIANLCFQNLRLSQLRDTLLPKLMSGEIEL